MCSNVLILCMFQMPWIDQGHSERAGTDRTHAGQVFRDMVDTCAGSRGSSAPGSSVWNRMARQPRRALVSRG